MTEMLLPNATHLTAPQTTQPVAPSTIEIGPNRGFFDLELGTVWRYRELLIVLTLRDIQVLYKQAVLGIAWAIVQPLFSVLIFTVIFGHFAKMPSDGVPYPVFAYAAVLPWTYFAEAVRRGATGLVTDAELVRKVYFPRLVMPLASVIAPMLDFAIAFVVLLGVMLCFDVMPSLRLLITPLLLLIAALLALAISLWLAPINVRFRDVKYTLTFMLQIWMYATPIVYPLSIVPEGWKWIYSLNPMVGVVEGFRWAAFGNGNPDLVAIGISIAVIGILLTGGLIFFRRMEQSFADLI